MVLVWDLEYKNQVMTRLITMLDDMKLTHKGMNKLLNLEESNPFDMTITTMKTLAMHEVDQKRRKDPRKNPSSTNNNNTKNDPNKKDDGKVLQSTPTAPTEGVPTIDNDDGNNDTNGKQVKTTKEPVELDGQVGLALSYDDYTLTVEEVWDLIYQDCMDENGQESSKINVDNSKPAFGLVAISKAEV